MFSMSLCGSKKNKMKRAVRKMQTQKNIYLASSIEYLFEN